MMFMSCKLIVFKLISTKLLNYLIGAKNDNSDVMTLSGMFIAVTCCQGVHFFVLKNVFSLLQQGGLGFE